MLRVLIVRDSGVKLLAERHKQRRFIMNRSSAQQEKLVQEYKPLLFSIAYHMLGSVMDAEDCVQEAFLQWYASEQKQAITNPKAYLCTLVTRRCIDRRRSAQTQRETYVGLWLPEPLVEPIDPFDVSEQNESLSIAFLLLLEHLSPIERAVFLLRQVFDYDYAEIAAVVGKSAENCRQIMYRARQRLPACVGLLPVPHVQQWQVFTSFVEACTNGDMEGLLHVLSEEVVLHTDGGDIVVATRHPLYGPDRVARFLLGVQQKWPYPIKIAIRPRLVNGQPGLIGYLEQGLEDKHLLNRRLEGEKSIKQPIAWYQRALKKGEVAFVMALAYSNNQIQEVDIIVNPEKFQHIPVLDSACP